MSEEYEGSEEFIPLKDLLKKKRKAAYEEQKAHRKLERRQSKIDARTEKAQKRAENDQKLWGLMAPASTVDKASDDSAE